MDAGASFYNVLSPYPLCPDDRRDSGACIFYFVLGSRPEKPDEVQPDHTILRPSFALKSLAVVLGLAPLLLIQVGFPVPFFNSVGIFAPSWILIIVFLIASFLSFDALGHKLCVHKALRIPLGLIGLLTLLPCRYTCINSPDSGEPDQWDSIIQNGYPLGEALPDNGF